MTDEATDPKTEPDTGLTIDAIFDKYADPRFDLLRDPTYMSMEHWAIFEMYVADVIVNAVTTASQEVIAQYFPSVLPPLTLELLLDMLRSEQSVRHIALSGGIL